MFLNLGQNTGDGEDDAEDHVEADEELVELALTDDTAGVVGVAHDDGGQGEDVEHSGDGQEGVEPATVIALFIVFSWNNKGQCLNVLETKMMLPTPTFRPTVCKVNDEDELNDDEHEASNHAKVHPGRTKVSMGNKECSNPSGNDDGVLESPEAVLYPSSWISTASDPNHDEGHEQEEDGDNETYSINSEVADGILTFDLVDTTHISNSCKK